jgi:hypothetical protein
MMTAKWRSILRWTSRIAAVGAILIVSIGLFWMRHAIYHRWIDFPKEAAAWAALRADRQPVAEKTGWTEYKGLLHSHSHFSHDCEVSFEHILQVLKQTGRDFICLSDHCDEGKADFNVQWRGLHDGKLFIPGFEMQQGLMPFGVAPGVVLSNRTEVGQLAQQIRERGGLLFFAHPEERRAWELPELDGMEIYNLHADFKDERRGLLSLLPDLCFNLSPYPDQVVRMIFDRPTANLRRWDECNRTRHLTGIAGNDCHQNVGVRALVTATNTLRIEDTSPDTLAELKLNWLLRPLLRLCFGPLSPGRELFHLQLDPYERMTRFVATHVLAHELTEPDILDALKHGRAFVGFDLLADSSGFLWYAQASTNQSVMGESMPFTSDVRFRAAAPQACRFTVVHDGDAVHQQQGRTMDFTPTAPGVYRVEAELLIRNAWVPWIYANPIWLR